MLPPIAGLQVTAGTTAQALTTAFAQLTCFNTAAGGVMQAGSDVFDGNPAIVPDKANNRIKLLPGVYLVAFQASILADSSPQDLVIQLRKAINGVMTAQTLFTCEMNSLTSLRTNMGFSGVLSILKTDPGAAGLATFPDPSGGFSGAGGAPKTETWIDLTIKSLAGTPSPTIEYCQFWAMQVAGSGT